MKHLTGTLVISLMLLGALGIIATFPNLTVPIVHATTQIQINNQDTFEGLTFNTTGIVKYNSTAVTDGHLTVTVRNGTATVKTTTYTITAQVAGHNAVRFILFAHVKDSASLELAAYLYVDVSNGTVTAYFAARNDDFNQNGIIDINDYSVMQAHYGYCSGNPEFDPETDLNANGCTDINDFSIMSVTYGFKAYRLTEPNSRPIFPLFSLHLLSSSSGGFLRRIIWLSSCVNHLRMCEGGVIACGEKNIG